MGSVSKSLTTNQRPHLLHNWAASLLTIAQKTYQQAEHFHGPLGSITRTLASAAIPILDPLQRQWLSFLSIIDDKILSVEEIAMTVFPPSAYLFSMIDELALLADSFPKRFDDAIDTLASLIQHFPLFEPVVNPVLTVMGSWGWSDHDKDTTVDIKCDEQEKKMLDVPPKEGVEDGHDREVVLIEKLDGTGYERKLSKKMEEEIKEVEETCNEIIEELEKMGIGNEEIKVDGGDEEEKVEKGLQEIEKEVDVVLNDPVMALFEEGWGGKKRGIH